jgi:flagellar hook-length control protein FliK
VTAAVDLASALRAEEPAAPGRAQGEGAGFEETLVLAERRSGEAAPERSDGLASGRASRGAGSSASARSDEGPEPAPSEEPQPPAELAASTAQAPLEPARALVPEIPSASEPAETHLATARSGRRLRAPLESEPAVQADSVAASAARAGGDAASRAEPGLAGAVPRAAATAPRAAEVRSQPSRGTEATEASRADAPPRGLEAVPRDLAPAAVSAVVAPPNAPRRAAAAASSSARPDAPDDVTPRAGAGPATAASLQPQGAADGAPVELPAAPRRWPTPDAPEPLRPERGDRSERTSQRDPVDPERAEEASAARALAELRAPVAEAAAAPPPSTPLAPTSNPGAWLAAVQHAPAASGAAAEPLATPPAEAVPLHVEWLAARGGGAARLRLHPPELGEIDLSVRVRDGAVQVVIRAREPAAQRLVAEGRVGLVDALAARDLRVETFQVLTADGEARGEGAGRESALGDPREGAADREERRSAGRSDRSRSPDFADGVDHSAARSNFPQTGGDRSRIDLRI